MFFCKQKTAYELRISDLSSDVCSSDLPDACCILPMTNRVMQVRLDADTGVLEALVLTAGQAPLEDSFIAMPTANMTPFDRRGSKVFVVGVAALDRKSTRLNSSH